MIRKATIVFICLAVATPALAKPWARITRAEGGDAYWVDLGSIAESQGHRKAWTRAEYARPLDGVADGAVEAVALTEFNCAERETNLQHVVYYDRNGDVIRSKKVGYSDWQAVVPDTVREGQFNFVCSYPIGTDWRNIEGLEVEE